MTDMIDRAEVLKLFRNKHPLELYNAIAALPPAPDAVEALAGHYCDWGKRSMNEIAQMAYTMADAMLAERAK